MSVFRRQSINPHLDEVVKVVLPPYPAIAGLQTVGLVGDVFRVQAFTVVELPFEQLESQIEKEREREVCRATRLPFTHYLNCTGACDSFHSQPLKPGLKGRLIEHILIRALD